MEPIDGGVDEWLRKAATADPVAVERVVRRALAAAPPTPRTSTRFLAVAASLALLVGVLGTWHWAHRPPPSLPFVVETKDDVVLVRAPDGSSLIFSAGPGPEEPPPGSGYVIVEGETR